MPTRPKRKLKVFQAQIGFFDTVIAAPSQAAALRAWGTHQNLFATGDARPATDANAVQAALEQPETPLRRAVGSADPFQAEPKSLPKVPHIPKRPKEAPGAKPAPRRAAADRSKLDAAEAELRKIDDRRKIEEAELRRQEDALQAKKSEAQEAYVDARKKATAALEAARQAYRKAGGGD